MTRSAPPNFTSAHTGAFSCSAPGKLLLFGEHIVLRGGSAAGLPIRARLHARFTPSATERFICASVFEDGRGGTTDTPVPADFFIFVQEICRKKNLPVFGENLRGRLELTGSIAPARGLGSSAALCVVIARILLYYNFMAKLAARGQQPDPLTKAARLRTWRLAHEFEQFFHKKASGIDTAMCAFEAPLAFYPARRFGILAALFGQGAKKAARPLVRLVPFSARAQKLLRAVVFGACEREASNAHMIRAVGQQLDAPGGRSEKKAFITESQHASRALFAADAAGLFRAMRRIHARLASLGAVTPRLAAAVDAAQKILGETGAAKISGGGGGGAFVCLCPDAHSARAVLEALARMDMAAELLEP